MVVAVMNILASEGKFEQLRVSYSITVRYRISFKMKKYVWSSDEVIEGVLSQINQVCFFQI